MLVITCDPCYFREAGGNRLQIQSQSWQFRELLSQNKKCLWFSSSALAYHEWDPRFNYQYTRKTGGEEGEETGEGARTHECLSEIWIELRSAWWECLPSVHKAMGLITWRQGHKYWFFFFLVLHSRLPGHLKPTGHAWHVEPGTELSSLYLPGQCLCLWAISPGPW